MRSRRFARCIERAATDLEAGRLEDVRDALDEARVLCPDAPEIAELEHRFAALPSPGALLLTSDTPRQEPPAGWMRVLGAMCVLILLFGLFGFGLTRLYLTGPASGLLSSYPVDTVQPESIAPPPPAARPPQPEAQERSSPKQAAKTTSPTTTATPTTTTATATPTTTTPPTATKKTTTTKSSAPRRSSNASRENVPLRPPARTEYSVPTPTPTTGTTPAVTTAERRPTSEPAAIPASTTAPSPVPMTDPVLPLDPQPGPERHTPAGTSRAEEAALIRSVLVRYETAYNRLDAGAASNVWPSVDQVALDRAFRGLISQKVSLGLCDITVVGNIGGASCAGKARWEPRVGGGLQTADRYWTFNLRKSVEGWRIEQIRVR